MGCNYLSLPEKPAAGSKVLICIHSRNTGTGTKQDTTHVAQIYSTYCIYRWSCMDSDLIICTIMNDASVNWIMIGNCRSAPSRCQSIMPIIVIWTLTYKSCANWIKYQTLHSRKCSCMGRLQKASIFFQVSVCQYWQSIRVNSVTPLCKVLLPLYPNCSISQGPRLLTWIDINHSMNE